jgi:nucleoside-diphosphate-sugar epimerase
MAGIKPCASDNRKHGTDFMAIMPSNVYGPGDSCNLEGVPLISALIREFHEAKIQSQVTGHQLPLVFLGQRNAASRISLQRRRCGCGRSLG